ncbi:uncharacterized protein LOC141611946 [Silene latifolia]|uniref:uncharacterized protein LOC141611946 n=1 Tax=Silene latifolia TaxID=37657 RepID=UPI003D779086
MQLELSATAHNNQGMQLEKTADGIQQHTSPSNQFTVFGKAVNRKVVILADPKSAKPLRVGRGLVDFPTESAETLFVHGEKLLSNHRKGEITQVLEGHKKFQLPVPVRDDITMLADAVGSFIQWPESHIFLARSSPPQPKAVGGTKNTDKPDKPDKPKSPDMPTTSSKQQLDEGTKKTDKPKSPDIPPIASSLKEQVDEAGGSITKREKHYFPAMKDVRSIKLHKFFWQRIHAKSKNADDEEAVFGG